MVVDEPMTAAMKHPGPDEGAGPEGAPGTTVPVSFALDLLEAGLIGSRKAVVAVLDALQTQLHALKSALDSDLTQRAEAARAAAARGELAGGVLQAADFNRLRQQEKAKLNG
jgi:hypothetical protein